MTRAAIYARVSTTGQEEDGTSHDTQVAVCLRYATDRGYEASDEHTVRGIYSGAALYERPKLSVLRESARRGEVGVVVCYALDRLSRRQVHTAILADEFQRAGARLEFVTEDFEDSAVGTFMRQAKAFAAELEREKILKRTMRGLKARVMSGKPRPGRKAPFGYLWRDEVKSGYTVDPEAAPTVEWIFASAVSGMSLRQIAKQLNDRGVPTPTGREIWRASTLHAILTNSTYIDRAVAIRTIKTKSVHGRSTMRESPADQHISLPEGVAPPLVAADLFNDL